MKSAIARSRGPASETKSHGSNTLINADENRVRCKKLTVGGVVCRVLCEAKGKVNHEKSSHRCRRSSGVLVVQIAIEKASDNSEHRSAKAYFIANNTTEDSQTICFGGCGFVFFA